MRTVNVDIDIDIDDFLLSMGGRDYEYLLKYLKQAGYVDESVAIKDGIFSSNIPSFENNDFNNAIFKLSQNRHRLSIQEEELIINLAKKL